MPRWYFSVTNRDLSYVEDAYLFIASNYGKVYTLRLSDATVVSSSVLPSVTSPTFIERIAVLTASNTVLVHRGIRGQAESRILATTFSTATGTLSEWEDRTPAISRLPPTAW